MAAKDRLKKYEGRIVRSGVSRTVSVALVTIIMIVIIAAGFIGYNAGSAQQQYAATTSSSQDSQLQSQVNSLENQVSSVQNQVKYMQSNLWRLPLTNQTPTAKNVWVEWEETQSGQDRFYPNFITVNQGDTIQLTFINNDTVAHDFVIGSPYNIMVNSSMPGLYNDLTGEEFTSPALHNSPSVEISGSPGNVTTTYTFVAKFAGIYEFICTYHVQVGMFGYLVVLPNAAYNTTSVSSQSTAPSSSGASVSIAQGSYNINQTQDFVPDTITVMIGVNNTVTWTNNDIAPHTVTSDTGLFDSGNLNSGQSWSHTFTTPGVYSYRCSYHPWMKGTVIVKAG